MKEKVDWGEGGGGGRRRGTMRQEFETEYQAPHSKKTDSGMRLRGCGGGGGANLSLKSLSVTFIKWGKGSMNRGRSIKKTATGHGRIGLGPRRGGSSLITAGKRARRGEREKEHRT